MKKWKTIFNVLIAIGIVGICYSSMYFEFNDKTIMSRNEAMRNYNNIVESSFSDSALIFKLLYVLKKSLAKGILIPVLDLS